MQAKKKFTERSFNLRELFSNFFNVDFILSLFIFNIVVWFVGASIGGIYFSAVCEDDNKVAESWNIDIKYKNEKIVFKNVFIGEVFQDKVGVNNFLSWIDEKEYRHVIALAKESGQQFINIYNDKTSQAKDVFIEILELGKLIEKYFITADTYEIIKRLEKANGEPVSLVYGSLLLKKKIFSSGDIFNLMFFPYGVIICVFLFYIAFGLSFRDNLAKRNRGNLSININKWPRQVFALIFWLTLFFPIFFVLHILLPIFKFLYSLDFAKVKEWSDKRKKKRQYDEDVQYGLNLLRKAEERVDSSDVKSELKKMISLLEKLQKIRTSKKEEEKIQKAINYAESLSEIE